MIPFTIQFRVETNLKKSYKVLVTHPHVNHNKLICPKLAEITNNLAGNFIRHKFTDEAQIGQGCHLPST